MTNNNTTTTVASKGWYNHDSQQAAIALKAKVNTTARQHSSRTNLIKLIKNKFADDNEEEKTAKEEANADYFAILVEQINPNAPILMTICNRYEDKGVEALAYILECFSIGDDPNRAKNADREYDKLKRKEFPTNAKSSDVRDHLTQMSNLYNNLTDTTRAISPSRHSHDMIDLVENISEEHRRQLDKREWSEDELAKPDQVATFLEGLAKRVNDIVDNDTDSTAKLQQNSLRAMIANASESDLSELSALVAQHRRGNTANHNLGKEQCGKCGKYHKGPRCYADEMARSGNIPEEMSKFSEKSRNSIIAQANEMRKKNNKPPIVVAMAEPVVGSPQPNTLISMVMQDMRDTYEVHIDSKAGAGFPYHYITDPQLFAFMVELDNPIVIGGVGGAEVMARHIGVCEMKMPDGETIRLQRCLYAPDLQFNLLSVYALNCDHHKVYFNDENIIKWSTGVVTSFDSEKYSVRVGATAGDRDPHDVEHRTKDEHRRHLYTALAVFQKRSPRSVQYAGSGRVRIDVKSTEWSAKKRATFELHSARLNDPSMHRLKQLHKNANGVHEVLREANMVNTATDARMLADPPAAPAKEGTTPDVDKPGARTDVDIATMPVEDIHGNKHYLSCRDAASTDFECYPMKKKSDAPAMLQRFINESKAKGVDMDSGGVVWSDNEIVLNSVEFDTVASENHQARGNSVDYKPTGNAGAESTIRLSKHEMRKNF